MRKLRRARQRNAKKNRKLRHRAVAAGAAAAITLGAGVTLHKALAEWTPDIHQRPVAQDADADLIANAEELAIGYLPFDGDQNQNGIPDGDELARRCCAAVAALPEYYPYPPGDPPPDETYKIGHMVDGTEECHVCGGDIHMGGWEIINPRLGLKYPDPNDPLNGTFLPDLALHYMHHGSFDCAGEIHTGRVDFPRLLRVLELRFPNDPNDHQLPLDYIVKGVGQIAPDANDHDGDLLADSEELDAGTNLYDADQDDNLTPDGVQFAQQSHRAIENLPIYNPSGDDPEPNEPYKISYLQHGLELCETCGRTVNMGWWEIVNPKLRLSMNVFDVACHYMSHGSFSYSGLQLLDPHEPFHNGRVKLATLGRILELPKECGHLGTLFLPGDHNRDCKEDFKDFAHFADKWLDDTNPPYHPPDPCINYNVASECDPASVGVMRPIPDDTRFKAEVEGRYVNFFDPIHANCCRDEIELTMTLEPGMITILETEQLTTPCFCMCDFPTTATLGPFDDGIYMLEVYQRTNDYPEEFIGWTFVEIGPGG